MAITITISKSIHSFNKSFYKTNHIKCMNYKYNILTVFYDNISLQCKEHIDHLNMLNKKNDG